MCIDFGRLDLSAIRSDIKSLIPANGTIDAIFGQKTVRESFWHSGASKHGHLIQKTLRQLILASPGWESITEHQILPKNTLGKKAFIDNFAFNKSLNVAICIECKRKYENTSDPYETNIKRQVEIIKQHGNSLMDDLGFQQSSRHMFFTIFNAYGPQEREFNGDIRIMRPADLSVIFPTCVESGWRAFEKELASHLKKHDLINSQFYERVSDYPDFGELQETEETESQECDNQKLSEIIRYFDPKRANKK